MSKFIALVNSIEINKLLLQNRDMTLAIKNQYQPVLLLLHKTALDTAIITLTTIIDIMTTLNILPPMELMTPRDQEAALS